MSALTSSAMDRLPLSRRETAMERVRSLAMRCRNFDSLSASEAAIALANHSPAFWCSSSYSDDITSMLVIYANKHRDVPAALDLLERDFPNESRFREQRFLDKVLPLNEQAAISLARAYRNLSTFRSVDELFGRTDKAEGLTLGAAS